MRSLPVVLPVESAIFQPFYAENNRHDAHFPTDHSFSSGILGGTRLRSSATL
jgi:hypothetical protein